MLMLLSVVDGCVRAPGVWVRAPKECSMGLHRSSFIRAGVHAVTIKDAWTRSDPKSRAFETEPVPRNPRSALYHVQL